MSMVFEFMIFVAVIVFGVSYLALIACFIFYHNQLFNHIVYHEPWDEGIVFGHNESNEIDLDKAIEEYESEQVNNNN